MQRSSGLSVIVLCLACLVVAAWPVIDYLRPSPSIRSEGLLLEALHEQSQTARDRVTVARLTVDDVHGKNEERVAHRNSLRRQTAPGDTHFTRPAGMIYASRVQPAPIACASLLRLDDRLVQNLQLEIAATRGLLSQYESLAAAQARELDAHQRLRADCLRKRRLRRL